MPNKLSHSQVSKYQQCPTSWKLYYLDKIRSKYSRSALCFGTALDKAVGPFLQKSPNETRTPLEIFEAYWEYQEVNGVNTYLPTLTSFVYAKTDFDKDLITKLDKIHIKEVTGLEYDAALELVARRNEVGFDKLEEDEKKNVNYIFWLSLRNKGHYMVEAFKKKVLPRLTKIHSVQEIVELENEEGDKIIGYVDFIAEMQGYEGAIILDLKTSAMEYEEDSVITSPQLSLYVHALQDKYNTRKAGYIVLNKHLIKNKTKICKTCYHSGTGGMAKTCDKETLQMVANKKGVESEKMVRCNGEWDIGINPEVYVQFIVDDIPEQTETLVLENIEDINTAIKTGSFTRNLQSCTNTFGGLCDYINLCYRGSMNGLVQKEETKKDVQTLAT